MTFTMRTSVLIVLAAVSLYGIHGTSEPETIGYATSHGCVRLTNWDAHALAHRIDRGIAVAFVDPRHHDQGGH